MFDDQVIRPGMWIRVTLVNSGIVGIVLDASDWPLGNIGLRIGAVYTGGVLRPVFLAMPWPFEVLADSPEYPQLPFPPGTPEEIWLDWLEDRGFQTQHVRKGSGD